MEFCPSGRLNFPIELADGALSEKWKDLNEIYRPGDINEIIALLDSTGRVRMAYEPAANNPQETFFHKVLEEIKAGKE